MAWYLCAFGWGFLILLSLIGWGSALNRLLFPTESTDWGQRAAWGLALECGHRRGSEPPIVHFTNNHSDLPRIGNRRLGDRFGGPGRTLFGSLSLDRMRGPLDRRIAAAGSLLLPSWRWSNTQARFQYRSTREPLLRPILTGPMTSKPTLCFRSRCCKLALWGGTLSTPARLESALGGQSFLDTFVLSILPVQHLHLLDPGLSLLMILGLLWGFLKEWETPPIGCFGILLLFLLIPPPTVNIASLYTGLALFLSLCRTLAWQALPASRFLSRILIIALIAAAICSLKSTFIPAVRRAAGVQLPLLRGRAESQAGSNRRDF